MTKFGATFMFDNHTFASISVDSISDFKLRVNELLEDERSQGSGCISHFKLNEIPFPNIFYHIDKYHPIDYDVLQRQLEQAVIELPEIIKTELNILNIKREELNIKYEELRAINKHKVSVYVASSWRNKYQPAVVEALRNEGLEVYDFRNPKLGDNGFHWSNIDPNWNSWTIQEYAKALSHPIAESGFKSDKEALLQCDDCVLVLPSGRSAHLEAGCFVNKPGKRLIIFMVDQQEPELMYKLSDKIVFSIEELIEYYRIKV
jgi:hypothetical protein